MKQLIFLIFICIISTLNAQQRRVISIQLDTIYGKKKWYNPKDNFYISEVIDKRFNKIDNLGVVKSGILNISNSVTQFKEGTIEENFNQFFKAIFPKGEDKIPVYAELNGFSIFEVHQLLTNFIVNAELDINFYQKDENGKKILIGQFHEELLNEKTASIDNSKEKIVYQLIEKAISKIGTLHLVESEIGDFNRYLDTAYIPKKGIYLSYLDYIYDTPNENIKYTTKIKGYDCKVNIKNVRDSYSFFGYCDGERFYYNENGFNNLNVYYCKLLTTVGRFILFRYGIGVEIDGTKVSNLKGFHYYVLDLKMRVWYNLDDTNFSSILKEHDLAPNILEDKTLNIENYYLLLDYLNAKNSR